MNSVWLMHPEKGTEKLIGRTDLVLEPKRNGWRLQVIKNGNQIGIWGRRLDVGRDLSSKFVQLHKSILELPCDTCHLDGEIVAYRSGKEDSAYVASALVDQSIPVTYVVFDILELNGVPAKDSSYLERRQILSSLNCFEINPYYENSRENFDTISSKYEGVVFKNKYYPYYIGDVGPISSGWYKVKNVNTVDLIVCNIKIGSGKNSTRVGALNCYVYDDKRLTYVGDVGSGLTDTDRINFLSKPRPFVIEAKIRGFTGKHIQQGSYVRERQDLGLEDCRLEKLLI